MVWSDIFCLFVCFLPDPLLTSIISFSLFISFSPRIAKLSSQLPLIFISISICSVLVLVCGISHSFALSNNYSYCHWKVNNAGACVNIRKFCWRNLVDCLDDLRACSRNKLIKQQSTIDNRSGKIVNLYLGKILMKMCEDVLGEGEGGGEVAKLRACEWMEEEEGVNWIAH